MHEIANIPNENVVSKTTNMNSKWLIFQVHSTLSKTLKSKKLSKLKNFL